MPQDFSTGQVLTAAQMDTLSGAVDGYATTATAAGTTTLTTASMYQQFFTGSTTQTVTMPVASTLYTGQKFRVVNNSSGVVTVQSSGANTIYAVPAGGDVIFTCILASGTTAASWDYKNATLSAGGGKVLQVVQGTTTTNVANSTTTFTDTTLTATITPSSASSKVLVMISHPDNFKGTNGTMSIKFNLLRAGTIVYSPTTMNSYTSAGGQIYSGLAFNYLDSPATTSATIYKTQFANGVAQTDVQVQSNSLMSTIILLEIGA